MSNQLPEYQFNQSLHQEECTFAMLISRSGVTRPIVGDACRCEEASKLLVYHIQLLVATGLSDPWLKLEIRVSHTPRSASQSFSRTRLLKEILARDQAAQDRTTRSKLRRSASRVWRVKVTEIIRSLHHHLQGACATTRDNEVRPNHDRDLDDQDLDDRDAMIDYFCPDSVFALESHNTEVLPEIEGTNVRDETENLAVWGARKYWDAITQEELPAELTRAARQEELDFMQDWHVWDVVPITESWSVTGKAPLQGKWVDVNKGDLERPVVRSRYVAKEFANTKSDDFFSPTPPLEALQLLLSHAASGRSSSTGGRKILVMDARKAHLHAFAERNLGMCARLRRSLYGTRDAPARWEAFLSKQLEGKGFVRGSASPCCYRHSSKDLSCVVHGDDFVFAGVESDLEWARQQMEKSFLVKVIGRLGGDKQDVRELRVLNRVLSWRSGGIQLEANPRHQEILISELEQGVHGLSTPVVKNSQRKDGDGDGAESLLDEAEAQSFRSTAARASYLALDRPDLAFATKELCRRMSAPTKADVSVLRQMSRYLHTSSPLGVRVLVAT